MAVSRQLESVQEGQTGTIRFKLIDQDGAPVPKAAFSSVSLTLRDIATQGVINGRDGQDAIDANDVTIHPTTGEVTWLVQAADTPIVTASKDIERHLATFAFTWGARAFVHQILFSVYNIADVP